VTEIILAAAELQAFCDSHRWQFCIIGGLALQRWGEPRETVDVDITLLTGFGGEEKFITVLLERYEARVKNPSEFALANRVLLLHAKSGVGLDIALGALPFEEMVIKRSTLFIFPGNTPLRTCSVEDLIVMKAFAARAKDWLDVEGIIIRQTGKIDWPYVRSQLRPLVEIKGAPEILDELEKRRLASEQ